jgi:isoleucyl-tRNA synthetase
MNDIFKTNINDPKYLTQIQKQRKIKDDTKLVEDSLFALSKRVFELESFINKEIRDIHKHMSKSLENLEARNKPEAGRSQQYIMTGFNNLALMLSESMEQMQQQIAAQSSGTPKNCQGKKNGMPKKSMSQLQQQLNDQIDKLSKELKSGKLPGKGEMSKQMAEFAQKQAAIREALRKLLEEEGKQQSDKNGISNELAEQIKKAMEQMDKTETELANKKLTEEMLIRQKEILTRLLEAEESLRKREQDNQRESNTARDIERKMPPSLEEYLKKRDAEIQLYKTVPPSLSPYYKQLVEKYFKSISF